MMNSRARNTTLKTVANFRRRGQLCHWRRRELFSQRSFRRAAPLMFSS